MIQEWANSGPRKGKRDKYVVKEVAEDKL